MRITPHRNPVLYFKQFSPQCTCIFCTLRGELPDGVAQYGEGDTPQGSVPLDTIGIGGALVVFEVGEERRLHRYVEVV